MKKLLILSVCVLFLAACGGSNKPKNMGNAGKSIVCFGDSLTEGYGASYDTSYPAVLGTLTDRPVINLGVSGDTSGDGVARMSRIFDNDPYMVLIQFGGNDFRRHIQPDEVKRNILAIIRGVQAHGAIAAVVDTENSSFMGQYSKAMKEAAKETNSLYIEPILDGILNNRDLKSDQVHPNAEGYRLIALKIFKQIKDFL